MKNLITKSLFLISMLLPLSGCFGDTGGYGDPQPDKNVYTTILPEPSTTVSSRQELCDAIDWHVYYSIPKFSLTVSDSYSISDLKTEMNKVYWQSELVNGMVGMSSERYGQRLDFEMTYYDRAYRSASDENSYAIATDVNYRPSTGSFADFPVDALSNTIDVDNTQQLWYALEKGYRPNFVGEKEAEPYYVSLKGILANIIKDGMNDYDKFEAIYDYIINKIVYDYDVMDKTGIDVLDPDNYPDVDSATYKSFSIEGFIDDGRVVCDGYAKSYTALGRILGLDINRVICGTSDYSTRNILGHAFCFVKVDDVWYASDPTWATYANDGPYKLINHNYFLTSRDSFNELKVLMYPDLVLNQHYDYWDKKEYKEGNGLFFESSAEVQSYVDYLFERRNTIYTDQSYEFAYDDSKVSKDDIKAIFDAKLTANTYDMYDGTSLTHSILQGKL